MPETYAYNNLEDDPIMSDGSSNFTGVVSATKANRIDNTELASLSNGDIGAYGTVGARPPAKLVGSSLSDDFYVDENGTAYEDYMERRFVGGDYVSDTQKIWVFKGTNPKMFFFVDGKLFLASSLNATTWGEAVLTGIQSTSAIAATQLANVAYFVDNSKLRYYDGSAFAEVAKFKTYDETTSAYIDSTTAIPPATCIETHVERLCLSGITDAQHDPATIFFSDYLDGKTWLTTESIQVGSDGDAIIALKSWRNNTLLVFKASSVWAVICDPLIDDSGNKLSPAYWTVNKISDSYGVVSRETVAQVGNDVWFLSKRGVCSVQRAVAAEENEMQTLPISLPIQNYIDRINWNSANLSSAVYFKDRFFLSIPIDGSSRPNITLVYNTVLQKWQGVWEGTAMRATGYARANFDGIEHLIWRTHDGTVYQFVDDDMQNGFDICEGYSEYYEQTITTKSYVWEAPLNSKRALNIELEFYQSTGVADVSVKLDGKNEIPVSNGLQISTSKKLPLKIPFALGGGSITNFKFNIREIPRFRELQVVVRTRNGRATLRNININALIMPR